MWVEPPAEDTSGCLVSLCLQRTTTEGFQAPGRRRRACSWDRHLVFPPRGEEGTEESGAGATIYWLFQPARGRIWSRSLRGPPETAAAAAPPMLPFTAHSGPVPYAGDDDNLCVVRQV